MKSSPRNFRLTEEGLQALKILESQSPSTPRGEIVSKAIVNTAKGALASPPVQFRLLDPQDFFHLQATLAQIEALHRINRDALLKIRPADKGQADKLAQAVQRIDDETDNLAHLRLKLANLARATDALTPEDQPHLDFLIRWVTSRIKNENTKPEHKPVFELELRLLQSLLP